MLKSTTAQLLSLSRGRSSKRNLRALLRFLAVLACLITVYSIAFHLLMLREGQEHTWITGFYWTLTVMSTLGFGDITFHTDLGRAFSILVLLSGMVFMLVLLPFTFIEFFYQPWVKAQAAARTPKGVGPDTSGHVVITSHDSVTAALIRRVEAHRSKYVVVVASEDEALRLQDDGVRVAVGALDELETYRRVRADHAAMVVATGSDVINTSVAFTAREVAPKVRIVATAQDEDSVDILKLAGCNDVLRLEAIVGEWFARRVTGGPIVHVIGHVGGVLVGEVSADRTTLVGRTPRESQIREKTGVTLVGVYERGRFEAVAPDAPIRKRTVLVLAASKEGTALFNETFAAPSDSNNPVLILGGGRVGRATARAVAKGGKDYRIVEKDPSRIRGKDRYVLGDAANLDTLRVAGLDAADSIVITTHDDDMNVYLTLYCRRLRPEVRIIARASDEPHVATLHRAGADYVVSYASTGASTLFNFMQERKVVMVGEGIEFLTIPVPPALVGRTVQESTIRERSGCTVVAVKTGQDSTIVPGPDLILPAGAELLVVGTSEAQERLVSLFARA